MQTIQTIATHNGVFHADEVFAIAMLKMLYPTAVVLRTRDQEILKKADLRVDVGTKYDPATNDFDHHQPDGAGARPWGIPYAACGLVWKQFGVQLAGSQEVADYIDAKVIQPIDANDCGIQPFVRRENVLPYTIAEIIQSFNPSWQEEKKDAEDAFRRAVHLAQDILRLEITNAQGRIKARDIVRSALAHQPHTPWVILEPFCPWEEVLVKESTKVFCLFPSETEGWVLRTIPKERGSFETRKTLPKAWAGLSGQELAKVSGIPDAIFCHRARFIAGAKSKESILAMAKIALETPDEQ